MKGTCHDPVGTIEGFFHTITVVYIDIDVENTSVIPTNDERPNSQPFEIMLV